MLCDAGGQSAIIFADEIHRLVCGTLGDHSHCVACSDLGATTASPADPI
jgi:hypothetical protein